MSFFSAHVHCSLCNKPLTLWNINTCTKCGHKLCSHHIHLIRNPHSFVLSSVCYECADRPAMFSHAGVASQEIKRSARV
jgi:hypothetical protein